MTLVVDASIAVKWVVPEVGSAEALTLRTGHRLAAPELIVAECANILWRKVKRGEISGEEADIAARLLERADIELWPMRGLMRSATDMAVRMSHPAYACIYLTFAVANGRTFVTADESLVRKARQRPDLGLVTVVKTVAEVARSG